MLVRREFDHFCWLTWWKITDELRKNYGKITHKSLTNHALQCIGTKRPQTGRIRGYAWRIRDGKPRIISALSLVNCVWIAHDSRMNCAKNAQEALKLRSFRAYKTDAAAVPCIPVSTVSSFSWPTSHEFAAAGHSGSGIGAVWHLSSGGSCWTQRNLTLRRNLRCGARVRCAPLGSRTWTDGRWLVGWLNIFIYRTNIVRAPKLESLTG